MRRLALLAIFAASFAAFSSVADACPAASQHVNAQQSTAFVADSANHLDGQGASHLHEDGTRHEGPTCECAGIFAALAAVIEIDYPAPQVSADHPQPTPGNPRQLTGDFYGPPKSFA